MCFVHLFFFKQMFCLVRLLSGSMSSIVHRQLFSWWWLVCSGVGALGSSQWELMGDAMVTTEQVRLTPDMQSRQGAVWSRIVSIRKYWWTYPWLFQNLAFYLCIPSNSLGTYGVNERVGEHHQLMPDNIKQTFQFIGSTKLKLIQTNKCSPESNLIFINVIFSFCSNCLGDVLIQLHGPFGKCLSWYCWIV